MYVQHCRRAEDLVSVLAAAWAEPPAEVFEFDLAVVPGAGFQRWLSQQLAGLAPDGICAGVEFRSAAALEARVLGKDDPWRPDRLAWTVQRLALASTGPELEPLRRHLAACRESFSASRRVARQFAGYLRHRSELLAEWTSGGGLAAAQPATENAWQAHLWLALLAELGDPGQHRRARLDEVRAAGVPGLPRRIAVLAPNHLDQSLLELLEALDDHHRVDLLVLAPTPARRPARVSGRLPRRDFGRPPGHPLNLALGQLADEAAALLPPGPAAPPPATGGTRLGRLQAGLFDDAAAATPGDPGDESIQFHLSHDLGRQVEVLREVLTATLAADPSLEPRDIVVLTPDVDAVAPLVTAAFSSASAGSHPASRFRVQLADRSVSGVNSAVNLLLRLLQLPDTRLEAGTVLALAHEPGVAARFGFSADDRERLGDLVQRSGVRWGLSAGQRAGYGLGGFPQNTWFAGLQRMLLGVALPETDLVSAGTVLPLDDVESSDIALIGGLTELVGRLSRILAEFATEATLPEWLDRCRRALDALWRAPAGLEWELSEAWAGLARIGEAAGPEGAALSRPVLARVVADAFDRQLARGAFGNGALIVAGLQSLRHVPHRVVVLLGWDAGRYPRPAARGGDDLLSDEPCVGDPSAGLLDRQLLLDAVHAARERFIVVAQGRSVATNEPVPLAAPLADLLASLGDAGVVHQHPLQPFDPSYFDGSIPGLTSADPLSCRAARAALTEPVPGRPRYHLAELPPPDLGQGLTLDQLTDFFTHPARALLKVRAGLVLSRPDPAGDEIPIELDHLQRWQIGNRVLQRLRAGHDPDAVRQAEWLRGEVPPFALGQEVMAQVLREAERSRRQVPATLPEATLHDLVLSLPVPGFGAVPLVGRVRTHGTELLTVEFSSLAPRHRLVAWLRLLLLAAAEPGPWRARVVGKGNTAVYVAPPAAVAERRLAELVATYAHGLTVPLPAPPRFGMEWAGLRASRRDPLDPKAGRPRLRDRWRWETDASWELFFDFDSLCDTPAGDWPVPGADPSEKGLAGALASAIWGPILAAEVTE